MKTAEEIVRKRKEEEKHILYKVSENAWEHATIKLAILRHNF
jgi:hypothetical protein